ncbi:MAG: aerobic carbon-monoxide dehydrogenase small subunit [Phycisphaerales bacterium]|jgi:aerobic-type carbon monoxide dehydrogenase small subunit (CoxS/CutS family)|nr:aerobic carbon-monoxide dehydrogenase small subunit [Phycisphaerales bacterium]
MPSEIKFEINGKATAVSTETGRSLLEVIREDLKLTGTKYGCGEGACGACTVLVDGKPTFSCTTPASDAAGKKVATIESLADGEKLHPVQQVFCDALAYQCGYCTPGMIMASVALLEKSPKPSDEEISKTLNGHLCRCCGYTNIVDAVRRASTELSRR